MRHEDLHPLGRALIPREVQPRLPPWTKGLNRCGKDRLELLAFLCAEPRRKGRAVWTGRKRSCVGVRPGIVCHPRFGAACGSRHPASGRRGSLRWIRARAAAACQRDFGSRGRPVWRFRQTVSWDWSRERSAESNSGGLMTPPSMPASENSFTHACRGNTFFRDLRRGARWKSCHSSISTFLQSMVADTPLVRNLENPHSLIVLLNGRSNLDECFAQIDIEAGRTQMQAAKECPDRVSRKTLQLIAVPAFPDALCGLFQKPLLAANSN